MALTEEQRRRMEENRKRALEIKRKKRLERERSEREAASVFDEGGFVGKSSEETNESPSKKRRGEDGPKDSGEGGKRIDGGDANRKRDGSANASGAGVDEDESSLESFELDASPHVTQTEASQTYCLPKGTIEVCSFVERDNPRHKGWSRMKLYDRADVRRRARRRFGGKAGLRAERDRRRRGRYERDMKATEDVFR